MRTVGLALSMILLAAAARGGEARPRAESAEKPLRVLFIGNSYTGVNDLPALVARLAAAGGGRRIETAAQLHGGATLEQHAADEKVLQRIRQQRWDVVVLQEQSQRPIGDVNAMYAAARKLHAEIKQIGAKTVLYLTWARQDKPQTQDALNRAYFKLARELDAAVAPVGLAWRAALTDDDKIALYAKDKSHPSPVGSYLAACVFYATLLDRNPEGLPAEVRKGDKPLLEVEPALARRLQKVAWKTVREVKDRPAKAKWAWEE